MSVRVMILMHYDTVAPVKRNINDIRVGNDKRTERMHQKANTHTQQPPHIMPKRKRMNDENKKKIT